MSQIIVLPSQYLAGVIDTRLPPTYKMQMLMTFNAAMY